MAGNAFTSVVCPLFGMILSNVMWFSPFKAMNNVRIERDMGNMNPIPFIAIVTNCTGWIGYALFTTDHFLFWSNVTGLVVGIYYTIISLTILAPKSKGDEFSELYLWTERLFLCSFFFWSFIGLLCATAFTKFPDTQYQCTTLIGTLSCFFSIAYYAAPLTTMITIVITRDASSLFFPTIAVNAINALCWFLYGAFGTEDIYLWLPNGLGLLLCGAQFGLLALFNKKGMKETLSNQLNHEGTSKLDQNQEQNIEKTRKNLTGWFPLQENIFGFKKSKSSQLSNKKFSAVSSPASISWHNLTVSTPMKTILHNLTGEMNGGLWAIMGSSGSGKTTLMSTLALRLNSSSMTISGHLRLNGRSYTKRDLKTIAGYVMQDDLLDGNFTVLETLQFTAHLRMPANSTLRDRQQRIQEVLSLLDISRVQDIYVGDTRRKGVSGGERKRLCVAMELLSRPQLLFLDEPTSGLDSHTALAVISMLQELSSTRKECTVVSTIHQPSTQVFALFDGLLLMSHGHIIYQGPVSQVLSFFDNLGYPCPALMNPADHVISVLASVEKELMKKNSLQITSSQNTVAKEISSCHVDEAHFEEVETGDHVEKQALLLNADADDTTEDLGLCKTDIVSKDISSHSVKKSMVPLIINDDDKLPWTCQVWVLFQRATLSHLRRWDVLLLNLAVTLLIAFFTCASVWHDIGTSKSSASRRQPALFFCVIHQGIVASLQGTHSFPMERALMLRERATGAYSISAYFLSKTLADMLIMQIPAPILFSCVVYPSIGFAPTVSQFMIFTSLMVLTSMAATSLANLAACLCVGVERASVFLAAAYEISRLYGAWFISPKMMSDYSAWRFADTLSYIKYSFVAVSLNENEYLQLHCNANELSKVITSEGIINYACVIPPLNKPPYSGHAFNLYYGYDKFTVGGCVGALILYVFGCRILAYLALRFIKT